MNKKVKTILIIIAAIVVVAFFVFMNSGNSYTGTVSLDDADWESISYEVTQGDADKLDIELEDSNKLKITYDGDYELDATVTATDTDGNSTDYDLRIYEEQNAATDDWEITTYFCVAE